MPSAELVGGRIVVTSELWEADRVKQVPGGRYHAQDETWRFPLSWATCLTLRGVFGEEVTIGPALNAWALGERERRVRPSVALREKWTCDDWPADDPFDLFETSKAGVRWLEAAEDCLILDAMGGGKSVQVATLLRLHPERLPCLIVCTNTMLRRWRDYLALWSPGLTVAIATGSAKQRRDAIESGADVTLINWQNLARHSRLTGYGSIRLIRCEDCGGKDPDVKVTRCQTHPKELNARPFATVVADEVHRAKTPSSQQTRALWAVGDAADRRIGLTGTAVDKRTDEFWSLLRFAAPHEYPSHVAYIDRWCLTNWTGWGIEVVGVNPLTAGEFRTITQPRWRRTPAAIVRGSRPEPVFDPRELDLETKQRKQYDQMKAGLIADCEGGGQLVAWDPLAQVQRLWQLASSCLDDTGAPVLPSVKVAALLELMDEADDEPIVVFAHHRRLLELAIKSLPDSVRWGAVMGGVKERDRHDAVDAFQAGRLRLMFCTYGAGGEGITLTRGHIMTTLQESWSAKDGAQAIGRLDRPPQERRVEVVHLRGRKTIDRAVPKVAAKGGSFLEEIVQDKAALLRWIEEMEREE